MDKQVNAAIEESASDAPILTEMGRVSEETKGNGGHVEQVSPFVIGDLVG